MRRQLWVCMLALGLMTGVGCASSTTTSGPRTSAVPSSELRCSASELTVKNLHGDGATTVTVHLRPDISPDEVLKVARAYTPDRAADLGVNGSGLVNCSSRSFMFTIRSSTDRARRDELSRRLKADPDVITVEFGSPD